MVLLQIIYIAIGGQHINLEGQVPTFLNPFGHIFVVVVYLQHVIYLDCRYNKTISLSLRALLFNSSANSSSHDNNENENGRYIGKLDSSGQTALEMSSTAF